MRVFLPPMRRPRHPLARVLIALLGLAVLGVFMVFGLIALAVFIAVGSALFLLRLWQNRHSRRPASRNDRGSDVIEGEFVVIQEHRHAPHH